MTRIIPPKLIEHLEWNPGQEVPVVPTVNALHSSQNDIRYDIDAILNGETTYSNLKDSDNKWIGLPTALREALDKVGSDGIIGTMPELIAAKVKADKSHDFWQKWYSVHTEENIGIDKNGEWGGRDEPVLVVVNGGGILTPDRIMQAYGEGLINHSAKYTNEEFDNLLKGGLPSGETIPLHSLDDIKNGITDLPHRFGVVMPYSVAQGTSSGHQDKGAFLENPLVIARNGGRENLEEYFEMAKHTTNNNLGNWHVYSERDPTQSQGRVLFLNGYYNGLSGNYNLNYNGRFVGVAPEAPHAP